METETNDIFTKGNKITTNRVNVFEVIDSNNYQVVLKDLLTDDFCVLDKAEHQYEQADLKLILLCALKEILEENDISI